ncbi:uncharacterized protein LOC133825289 [Humulus lupulus]|uniref:uncharacterized protein LOC133825289 n=1 Tax=Humulus lupulus TaxID=3486 RepID=UPI002B407C64|nr:uncharacterized protein LOC133825289 [Humulus lupulus]
MKKKRVARKPVFQTPDRGSKVASHEGEDVEEVASSSAGLDLIAEVANSGEISQTNSSRERPSGSKVDTNIQHSSSWAKEVESKPESEVGQGHYQESAKTHWKSFSKENMFMRDPMLSYSEPLIKDGMKIAQVDPEEVVMQAANWSWAVICMVLGANPPMAMFEGFIKRIWGHLGIAQVARMTMGLIMVRFNDDATRDQVLEPGVLKFDRKPVIIKPSTTDLNTLKLVQSVPLWIHLHDLGLQYWGNKSLSALVSTVGKPIMVDQHTRYRTRIQFARVLVEMDITDSLPRIIQFLNEHGQLVEQGIDYEWLPVKLEKISQEVPLNNKANDLPTQDKEWLIPKRTVQSKGQGSHDYDKPGSARQAGRLTGNAFSILQESGTSLEKGLVPIEAKGSGVGALLETKLKDKKINEMMMNKFSSWDFYNSPTIEGQEEAFCVTFVYRLNTIDERKSLWVDLLSLRFPVKPWLLLGDFNAVFNCEDRSGGIPISIKDLNDSTLWQAQAHVEALKRSGSFFTCSNNQEGASRIYSRIDHAFVNEEWHDIFPNTTAHFAWETISDHCSCVVAATISEKIGFKPFRYFNFWAEHQELKEIVSARWEKPLAVRGLKGIYYKLMRLKHILKKFNKATIGDVGTAFSEARTNFIDARQKVENRIATFITDQGAVNDNFTEVVDHFLYHFRGYMGSRSTTTMRLNIECMEKGARLNLEQQLTVLKPFSNKEIKRVLFSIPDEKSPGPDGYGSGFFKTMWPVLGA